MRQSLGASSLHSVATRFAVQVALVFGALVTWHLATVDNQRLAFLFGAPLGIAREAWSAISSGELLRHIGLTAGETLAGWAVGVTCGTIAGLALWFSRNAYLVAEPFVVALGALPLFALGPLFIFWFGTGLLSKVVLAAVAAFSVALAQSYGGTREVDESLSRVVVAFGGSRWAVFRLVVLPSAAIWTLAGARMSIGLALLGAFMGEFIAARGGLGYLIIVAEGLYNMNRMWVGVFAIVGLAMSLHLLITPVETWARKWKD